MFLSVFVLVFICTMLISNISSQAKGFLIPLKTDCNQQKLNWVVRLVHYSVSKAHKDYCQFSCWPAEEKKKEISEGFIYPRGFTAQQVNKSISLAVPSNQDGVFVACSTMLNALVS